jgi:AcrR family transcriptional regulator
MTAPLDTKQRILDEAERLFAENGFAGTSLRRIIGAAEVNLAAVHYHFHSKESLLEAVLMRRMVPLNQERLRLLDAAEQKAVPAGAALEDILIAFVEPPMRLILHPSGEGRVFGKLIGRLHSETGGFFTELAKRHFGPAAERFRNALHRALPRLAPDQLQWRIHFAVGAMDHTLSCWDQLEALSGGRLRPSNVDSVVPILVGFISAGFRAAAAPPPKQRPRKHAHAKRQL